MRLLILRVLPIAVFVFGISFISDLRGAENQPFLECYRTSPHDGSSYALFLFKEGSSEQAKDKDTFFLKLKESPFGGPIVFPPKEKTVLDYRVQWRANRREFTGNYIKLTLLNEVDTSKTWRRVRIQSTSGYKDVINGGIWWCQNRQI